MKQILKYICIVILVLGVQVVSAQVDAKEKEKVSKSKADNNTESDTTSSSSSSQDTITNPLLRIISADNQVYDATGEDERLISIGNVKITHDSIYMFCDTAVIVNGVNLEAQGNISIIKNDTIRIFSDSLLYLGDSLMAYFVGNVVLEDGDQQLFTSFLQYDLEKDWAIYTDTALLVADGLEIKSKRGIFHLDEGYVNFYEKVTIEGEDFNLLSDSLRYYSEAKKAVFLSPTIINQEGKRIYSEGGYYDMDDKQSVFFGNAQYVEGDNISTADTIKNNERTQITELIGNANSSNSEEICRADRIVFDTGKNEIELFGNGYFKNPKNEVKGDRIFFDQNTDDIRVSGRSILSNPPMIIIADDLDYKKGGGVAYADGNVIWRDTSSNFEILCDHARYIDSTDYMKAYNDEGKPILKNEVSEGDTLLLSGDTLISYTQVMGVDTHRFFQAYEHVEMINDQMQAISDSLSYNGRDSIFTLYGNPVMWSDSSQYMGDTIVIAMENNKIKQVDLEVNAMIIATSDFQFFDQIKGKFIVAYFEEGDIDKMKVKGGSESLYYMKDEDQAYLGVNKTICSNMTFIFDEGELYQTRYYKEPTSKLTPMDVADHEALKLGGFRWLMDKRPKTIDDLFF